MASETTAHLFHRLEQLNGIGAALSRERDIDTLLENILAAAQAITGADGGTLYSVTEDGAALKFEMLHTHSLGLRMGGTTGKPIDYPQLPLRKAGLWDIKLDHEGGRMPAVVVQQCTSEAVDREFMSDFAPSAKQNCSKADIQKAATGYVMDSVCTMAGTTVTSHAETSGDFNSAYTVNVTSHSQGGKLGSQDSKVTIAAKWAGPCKEGQKPGDVVMPGGFKMNVRDFEKYKSMVPH